MFGRFLRLGASVGTIMAAMVAGHQAKSQPQPAAKSAKRKLVHTTRNPHKRKAEVVARIRLRKEREIGVHPKYRNGAAKHDDAKAWEDASREWDRRFAKAIPASAEAV